jgi:hypothetical protein
VLLVFFRLLVVRMAQLLTISLFLAQFMDYTRKDMHSGKMTVRVCSRCCLTKELFCVMVIASEHMSHLWFMFLIGAVENRNNLLYRHLLLNRRMMCL